MMTLSLGLSGCKCGSGSETTWKEKVLTRAKSCNLQVEESDVYFIDAESNQLKRVALAGGEPSVLAEGGKFAVGEKFVYFQAAGGISRVSRQGGEVSLVVEPSADAPDGVSSHVVDKEFLYWATGAGVFRVALAGGSHEKIAEERSVEELALDETHLYLATEQDLKMLPLGGGEPIVLLDSGKAQEFDIRLSTARPTPVGDHVYGRTMECGVFRVAKKGGAVAVLAEAHSGGGCSGQRLTVGKTVVFDKNLMDEEALMEVPLAGGESTVVLEEYVCGMGHAGDALVVSIGHGDTKRIARLGR